TVIITRELAGKLFADGKALGKTVYVGGSSSPTTVIGILARLQTSGLSSFAEGFAYSSVLIPRRLDVGYSRYAIRTHPGQFDAVLHAVKPALYKANPMRVLGDESVRSFAQIRHDGYKGDVGMAVLMGIISLILIAVTAAGIVGLTSFWVGQRRKQ